MSGLLWLYRVWGLRLVRAVSENPLTGAERARAAKLGKRLPVRPSERPLVDRYRAEIEPERAVRLIKACTVGAIGLAVIGLLLLVADLVGWTLHRAVAVTLRHYVSHV